MGRNRIYGVAVAAASVMAIAAPASAGPKPPFSTPVLSCPEVADDNTIELGVCAGLTGAPAGFSVQWLTCDALADGPDGQPGTTDDNTWPASDAGLCKASFSGNANGSAWNLGSNACTSVVIGGLNDTDPGVSFNCNEPLSCETCYVFRAFAHANSSYNRSAFTANHECDTAACDDGGFEPKEYCTRSQGYFGSGNNSRSVEAGCFGGDPTGVVCPPPPADEPLIDLGGGVFTYHWETTGVCSDVQPGGGVFLLDTGVAALRTALGGGGASSYFNGNGNNATNMGTGGGLASQTGALSLNILFSGNPCTEGTLGFPDGYPAGYGDVVLCGFVEGDTFTIDGTPISAATAAALNGQSVSDVLAAANAYLGGNGGVPLPYGLSTAADLNELVANLNLAFDLKDTDGDEIDDAACGGMTAFATDHLASSCD
jgi:hypothetical protein